MKFTDPKRFADHLGKRFSTKVVEVLGKELESKASNNGNALSVSLPDADQDTIREVQSWLRGRGWLVQNGSGSKFEIRKD